MYKILPSQDKKPPATIAYSMKPMSPIYISSYIYYINNILIAWLFIYMCWRKTCIIFIWNREHGKQPDNLKIKGGRLAQQCLNKAQQMVCHLCINFKGFTYHML